MNADDVARYLAGNPDFFEQYADLLAQMHVSHPRGGPAIALADRQVLTLREKNRALEAKLAELIQFGEENDAISEKVHRLSCALLAAPAFDTFLTALYYNLREDFAVPHAALRLWAGQAAQAGGSADSPVQSETRDLAGSLSHPFCGPPGSAEVVSWFGEAAEHIRSVALMALREPGPAGVEGACIGMLALGSEDALRFYPEMGTLYLKRLGELVSAGIARFSSRPS